MRTRVSAVLVAALVATLVVVHPASAAGAKRYVDPIFGQVSEQHDVTYGQAVDSKGVLQQLKLDVYSPVGDTATDRGLLIWAHGSGFRYGDKSDIGPLKEYVKRGWVAISIEYRMRPELPANAFVGIVTDPTSVPTAQAAARDAQHDMQAAIRWARVHASTLGISPSRIAAGGMSAGAIMALMVAFNPNDPGDSGNPGVSSSVAAAISHAGAYVPYLQGGLPQAGAPPIAIYHGTNDEQVPYPTSPPGCLLTMLAGNVCEHVTFVGREHATLGTDLAMDFLYRYVIAPTTTPSASVREADVDADNARVLAGTEHIGSLGAIVGVDVPSDPNVTVEHTVELAQYVLDALGLGTSLSFWG